MLLVPVFYYKGSDLMEFEENDIAITIPKYNNVFIYFLVYQNKVVYVGQTRQGLIRPLSHKNKLFDTIKIIYCAENDLDFMEDKYITKYNPIYNKAVNNATNYSLYRARNKIRELFNNKITVPSLKKIIKELHIDTFNMNGTCYIKQWDFEKLIKYIREK